MQQMTSAARVDAVAAQGFTERQAAFLVAVLLHGGVCVGRQYCTFAGIARGEKLHSSSAGSWPRGTRGAIPTRTARRWVGERADRSPVHPRSGYCLS